MDLSYSPEEEAFRHRVRSWLAANVPAPTGGYDLTQMKAWQRTLAAAGYLAVAWPKEYGGAGLSPMEQAILNEEMVRARAPQVINAMAVWWVGPALMRFGTEAQKQRFIPKILTAEEIWATGYSEPSSGSDMAAKMQAIRDGDDYVVNGQKIWTTLAHISDWYFCLVRTSNDGPKWAGLSLLLIDMKSPGIEIRPIRQIDGGAEFNEVFLSDVRVPVANLLGKEGQGWEVVSSALVNERSGIAGSVKSDQALEWLIKTAQDQGTTADPIVRQRIADLAVRGMVTKCAGYRSLTDSLKQRFNPNLSASMKLFSTLLVQQFSETAMEILGPWGNLQNDERAPSGGRWARLYLYDRSMTIAGGTSEIQRNIIAQRVLGLPRH